MDKYRVRFIPLGGVSDVTKNMYVYEIYSDEVQNSKVKTQNLTLRPEGKKQTTKLILKDILIVDCGIGFPKEAQLGVDFVIPDISYLKDKTDKIRGIILTHGHEDHTTALAYHYFNLGQPPVFASRLTASFVENKFKEIGGRIKVNQIKHQQKISLGDFQVEFIQITHSIPDTMHLLIKTPVGSFYHGTDFKFDLTPPYGPPPDFYAIAKAGKDGVLCLLSDCLGAERPGLTLSEKIVGKTFEEEMRSCRGKFFMTTFSSNISRIRQCVEAAIKFNRKIVFLGRSMKENTTLAKEINYLPIPYQFLIKEEEVNRYSPNKICLIVAGSQGQYGSALFKIATKQNPYIKINPGDKIIFSSDPIPGNENEVYETIEGLIEQGADVYYTDVADQLHSSGHGNIEDLKFLARMINPKYFIPIGGTIRHQKQYQKIMTELGYLKENVFNLKEGQTVWFGGGRAFRGEEIETKNVFVDAYGVGDVGNIVLRDRQTLSTEGIVFILLIINKFCQLISAPRIFSRGFVFEKEEKDLYQKAIRRIEQITKPRKNAILEKGYLKREIINQLEDFFFQEKGRKPLLMVEIIEV
jgi:ribonuclease J